MIPCRTCKANYAEPVKSIMPLAELPQRRGRLAIHWATYTATRSKANKHLDVCRSMYIINLTFIPQFRLEIPMPADQRKVQKHRGLRQQSTLNPRPDAVLHPLFRNSEFFDPYDLLQVKYEMLRLVSIDKRPVSEAAKAFGFSRPSFYQAQAAFAQSGLAGLVRQKPGPRSGHKLTPAVMEFLSQACLADPSLRSEQLALLVQKSFGVQVHPRSIERQFLRKKKPL